jgi:hypothetical protein
MCVCVYVCVCVCIFVCTYVFSYIYISMHVSAQILKKFLYRAFTYYIHQGTNFSEFCFSSRRGPTANFCLLPVGLWRGGGGGGGRAVFGVLAWCVGVDCGMGWYADGG